MFFENTACSIQAEAIMTVADLYERSHAPIDGISVKLLFWFAQDEFDPVIRTVRFE
jgi:hypothetical protein